MPTSVLRPAARVAILVAVSVVVVIVMVIVVWRARGPEGMAGQTGDKVFAECLRSAGHDPRGAEDWSAASERRIGRDPATLTCVADDLPDISKRSAALAVAFPARGHDDARDPTQRLATLVEWYAVQPDDDLGPAAIERLGKVLSAMRANDPAPSDPVRASVARDHARTEQVLAWQVLARSQGRPANFDRWVGRHQAMIGSAPYDEVTAYVAWLRAGAPDSARAVVWRTLEADQVRIRHAVSNSA